MAITLDQKYVKVVKGGTTYNCIAVNAIKGGVTYNVWRAAKAVTYIVDNNVAYSEDVVRGNSVLSPTTFTPSKSGYTFVGWREDTAANSSVLSSKTMGDSEITLYAVFKRTMTLTYYNNTTTAATKTGTQYYNNGNVNNPSVTLSQASKSGWTARGWSTSTAANAGVSHNNGAIITLDGNYTLYGLYQQTITLSYSGNGSTSGSTASQSGTRYYNSSGNISNPSFTLASNGFTRSGYFFTGWDLGSAGSKITLSESKTAYAQWHTYTAFTRVTLEYAKVKEEPVYIAQNIDGSKVKGISFYVSDAWTNADWQGTQYVSKMWLKTSAGQEQLLSEYWIGAAGDHNSSSEKGKTLTVTWSTTGTVSVYLQAEVNGSGDAGAVLTDGKYIPR